MLIRTDRGRDPRVVLTRPSRREAGISMPAIAMGLIAIKGARQQTAQLAVYSIILRCYGAVIRGMWELSCWVSPRNKTGHGMYSE
jgi:hypothetical protein